MTLQVNATEGTRVNKLHTRGAKDENIGASDSRYVFAAKGVVCPRKI